MRQLYARKYASSPVELAALDVDTVLSNRHTEVLHGKHCTSLTATLTTTAVSWPLDAEIVVLGLGSTVFTALCRGCCTWCSCCASKTAHGVIACGVGRTNARELVRIGGDICNEFLSRKSQKAGKVLRRLRWGRETSACQVVVGNCIRYLSLVLDGPYNMVMMHSQ
jgi:hypothetical protein